MVSQSLLNNTNVQVTSALGGMQVLEYVQDMSVSPSTSKLQYYMSRMNVNKRQLLLNLNGNGYTVQAGAMQWTAGQIQMESGVKGVGGFLSGMAKAAVTKETVAKPIYTGYGQVMLEPTYRHILLTNLQEWGAVLSWMTDCSSPVTIPLHRRLLQEVTSLLLYLAEKVCST